MTMSFDNLRVGKKYHLHNYGEESEFEVLERIEDDDFKLRDLVSLDIYRLSDLIKYGMSDDFDITEIEE